MRRCLFIFSGLIFIASIVQGQKPVALQTIALFHGRQPEIVSPFNTASEIKEDLHQYVDQALSLTLRPGTLQQLNQTSPGLLRLQLPAPLNIDLDLYQVNIFSQTARIMTSEGIELPPNPENIFYRGMINGNPNSLAVVSVFEDKIQILYSDASGNKRIQQMQDGSYIAFADKNIQIPKQLDCFVQDASEDNPVDGPGISSTRMMTGNCVEVYIECDYKSYLDNGSSVTNTEEWVGELWNEVITLYENEDIPVVVSDIFIYTSPYPAFDTLYTTGGILNAFVSHMGMISYDGRLAHFMSTRPLGGGVAYLDVLCSTTHMCAVSTSLSTTIDTFPTYSWNVEVVTHEMGHNMGSSHTHACVWNGNNTQIDDCGNQWAANNGYTPEGSACYNPAAPILPSGGGTIMSYCHLIGGIGINFNNGFGPLPGDKIRMEYNTAPCNTGTCAPPVCTSLTSPVPNSVNVDVISDLFWSSSSGAAGYRLTIGTTPNGSDILNNVDVGLVTTYNPVNPFPYSSSIYVKIVPFNDAGDAINCTYQSFTTEPNIPPLCTQLTYPVNGATNIPLTAVIQWAHSVGNQTGYKITIGTTPNGTQITNNLNVGNVNFYDPPGYLPHSSTIYVKITPYGANGDVPGCITENFNTQIPINGDFCDMAINLPCGASISGNTSQAYPDPEAATCVVTIQAPGIWFNFVGDGQNTIITTCSQYGYDTQLNAYTGSCSGLTCVTGNDDFCNMGSRITFPTTNGTTYYVLVQGWNGQVGSFTLSRTCYSGPFYCQSGARTAGQEWIKTFNFAGYEKQSGSSHYSDYTNETITLSRGATYAVTITPQFLQSPKNEYYRVWIDLNKDGDFTDGGEQLFSTGPSQVAVTGNITIPLSAATGVTRLRVIMKRSAFPTSCELFEYGEVEDYNVNIRCNLVTSTTDSGNGSLRNVSTCADDLENVLFAPALNGLTINVNTPPIVVDGQWKWMANAGTNITIKASSSLTRVLSIPVGKSAEIQYLTIIGGTTATGSAIDNTGTLTLRSCLIKPAIGSASIPLRNNGVMKVFGLTNVIH